MDLGSRFAASWAALVALQAPPGGPLAVPSTTGIGPIPEKLVGWIGARARPESRIPLDAERLDGPTDPANADLRVAFGNQVFDLPHTLERNVDQQHHLAVLQGDP
jgi:hypothetical protein